MNPDDVTQLVSGVQAGTFRAIARSISLVENQVEGFESLLLALSPNQKIPVIGVTGSPGAGKSTLLNAMIDRLAHAGKKVAVVAIDPSSPFNLGALLGDRIRMHKHASNPNIFIRSLASRGNLGGLSAKSIEVVDIFRSAPFDYIFVETVGVGQSEVEIAGLADLTVLVATPDSGDDVQLIKAGIMEIANIFVVNKIDRDPEGKFLNKLKKIITDPHDQANSIPIYPVRSDKPEGIEALLNGIEQLRHKTSIDKRATLLASKTLKIIQEQSTRHIDKEALKQDILKGLQQERFNLYAFATALAS